MFYEWAVAAPRQRFQKKKRRQAKNDKQGNGGILTQDGRIKLLGQLTEIQVGLRIRSFKVDDRGNLYRKAEVEST